MALTDLTRISTSGIATGSTIDNAILRKDVSFRGSQVGVTSALFDSSNNALEFNDNVKIKLGNSGDLEIYHHTSNGSIINHFGNNHLVLRSGNRIDFRSANDDTYFARFVEDGSAEIYYDGNEKIRTTNEGALVTGILTATSFSGPTYNTSGIATFYDLRVSNNLTVEGTTTTLDTNLIDVDRVEIGANSNTDTAIVGIQSGTADIVNLFNGSTKVLTVDDAGNVGIGSATPASLLNLASSNPLIRLTDTDNGAHSTIGGESGNLYLYTNSTARDFIFRGTGEVARITGDGKLGIGSAIPSQKLDVNGISNFSGQLRVSDGSTSLPSVAAASDTDSGLYFAGANSLGLVSGGSRKLLVNSSGVTINNGDLAVNGGNLDVSEDIRHIDNTNTKISFTSNTISFDTTGSERLRINSDGQVVINRAAGAVRATSASKLEVFNDTYNTIYVSNSTAAINQEAGIMFAPANNTYGGQIVVKSDEDFSTSANRTAHMAFYTRHNGTAAERLRIKSDGKVFLHGTGATGANNSSTRLPNGYTFNIAGTSSEDGISVVRYNAGYGCYGLNIGRSKSATLGTNTAVADDDELGHVTFYGANGSSFSHAAQITAIVDGEVGTGGDSSDMPGALSFRTTPEGSGGGNPPERLRIASDGVIKIERGSASNTALEINTTATTNACRIKFNESGSNKAQIAYSHDNDRLELVSQSGNGIAIYSGGNLVWKFDTNGHLLPNSVGAVNIGSATAEVGNIYVADDKKAYFGSTQTLSIENDGTNSLITDSSSAMFVRSNRVLFQNSAGNRGYGEFTNGGSVYFTYDNVKRIETSGIGVTVTGEVAASQDYPNFRPTLDLNFTAEKKLDPRITYSRTGLASFVNEFGKVVLVGANTPRFDHDPVTRECKGLLIEESRTNLLKYSVDFASISGYNANYSNARSTLSSTTEVAPDGTNTASKYVRTAGQGTGEVAIIIGNTLGLNSGTVYTSSIFVKNVGTNNILEFVNVRASSAQSDSQFNLALGTITTEGSENTLTTITPYPNDWYRISVTATMNAGSGYFWIRMYNQPEGDGFIIWGGQVEAGTFPTSYIPTYNNASVSRGSDLVEITEEEFSEFYNRTEGSIVSEIMLPSSWPMSGYGSYMMTLSDGSYDNRVTLASSTGSAQFNADINIGSSTPSRANLGSYTSGSHSIKAAMAYKISDSAGSLNGAAAVTTSPSGTLPLLTRADIGKDHANYNLLNGHMKRIMYYSKRLSNNQLRTLTS